MWVIFSIKGDTTVLIIEPPTLSLCSSAGNRGGNNKHITVNTEADYTLLYHSFTQTLDKPMPRNLEKQIMGDSWL